MLATLAGLLVAQDPELTAVRSSEARRVNVIGRCAPAVCSVMDMASPGGGSGVIIDPAGFVLTNFHVVGQADPKYELPKPPEPPAAELTAFKATHPDAGEDDLARFVADWQAAWRQENLPSGKNHYRNKKIGLPDGELYEGVVLGIDPGSDLAVLRLLPRQPGQRWPACELGDSDQLLVGETVFAMGNPFLLATDFTPTVTFGVVSGTHRYQEGQGNRMLVYPDCIQIDAPVNPGNSGGPLFNERGEVVGINGRISIGDRGRVNVGVGFAIASNQIRNFLGDLLAGRHAEHGTLDMSAWYMTAPHEESRRRGVFVQQMFRDSVVTAAGVSLGDEITMFNGVAVRSANQLATLVGVLPAGTWVTLGFRPALGDSGYGAEKVATLRLTALDTGSSTDTKADTARLASGGDRRLATAAIAERFTASGDSCLFGAAARDGLDLELASPDNAPLRFRSRGELLRIDSGGLVLVRPASGPAFRIADGVVADASAEEIARLEREQACNPFLSRHLIAPAALAKAGLLTGGVHVLGEPALRFAHSGEGELETFLFWDGRAAGWVLRDPLRRARIEIQLRVTDGAGAADEPAAAPPIVRVVVDGKLEPGWRCVGVRTGAGAVPDELFRRPQ